MVIDFHTHIFPDKIASSAVDKLSRTAWIRPFADGTAGDLCSKMKEAGIDRSYVLPVATNPKQVRSINAGAAERNADDTPLYSAGCIHPECADYRTELSRVQKDGIKGIKIHPVYQGVDLDDIRFLRILDRAAELGLFVITHTGDDIGFPGEIRCSPQMARHAVEEVGNFTLICAHMGGWGVWDEAVEYLADTRVFIDTSFSAGRVIPRSGEGWNKTILLQNTGMSAEPLTPSEAGGAWGGRMLDESGFMKMIDAFGPKRVLFGTDSPWSELSGSLELIKKLPLGEDAEKQILGKNAMRLLNLSERML